MASTTLTPQLERELADLQRRAYGPDADIHLDATAMARLRELEALSQTVSTASVGSYVEPAETAPIRSGLVEEQRDDSAAPVSDAVEHDTARAPRDPVPVQAPAQIEPVPVPPADKPRTWWRRAHTWILLGIGVVVGGLIVAGIVWAVSRPDVTLPIHEEATPLNSDSYLEYLELDPDALRSHGTYGALGVWTGETRRGLTCLLLTIGVSVWDESCTPDGIDPVVDVTLFEGDFAARELNLPERSVVRFVARGDVVDVWIAVPPEPSSGPNPMSLLP